MTDCDCHDEHEGAHPTCPKCQTDETRRVRNFGVPVGNEWWCLKCHHRWEPVRTKFIDFDSRHNPKTSFSCIKCQKDLKPGQKFRRVQTPSGEPFAIHPEDSARATGETEWHFIGYNCAQKLGLKWTHPPVASTEPVRVKEPGPLPSPEAMQLLAQVAKASKDSQ